MEFATKGKIKKFCIKRHVETSPSAESIVCSASFSVSVALAICQQHSSGGQILFSKPDELRYVIYSGADFMESERLKPPPQYLSHGTHTAYQPLNN